MINFCTLFDSNYLDKGLALYRSLDNVSEDFFLYFYSDPKVIFDEIKSKKADAAIVPHRFCDDNYGRSLEERNGKYCVEFNYFNNNENGMKILKWWKEKCLEWCYDIPDKDRMGDQKYLNSFQKLFHNVCEIDNLCAGIAPWNLKQYTLIDDEYYEIKTNKRFDIVFYHFQNIRYINNNYVNIKSQTDDKRLKYSIYIPYLIEIENIRNELYNTYDLDLRNFKIARSSNRFISFLQRYFAALKIRKFSDVINLSKLEKYL